MTSAYMCWMRVIAISIAVVCWFDVRLLVFSPAPSSSMFVYGMVASMYTGGTCGVALYFAGPISDDGSCSSGPSGTSVMASCSTLTATWSARVFADNQCTITISTSIVNATLGECAPAMLMGTLYTVNVSSCMPAPTLPPSPEYTALLNVVSASGRVDEYARLSLVSGPCGDNNGLRIYWFSSIYACESAHITEFVYDYDYIRKYTYTDTSFSPYISDDVGALPYLHTLKIKNAIHHVFPNTLCMLGALKTLVLTANLFNGTRRDIVTCVDMMDVCV